MMEHEWWEPVLGIASVVLGGWFLYDSVSSYLEWSEKTDDFTEYLKVTEISKVAGGLVLVVVGMYLILKFF